MKITYYRLLDDENRGTIVKSVGQKQYEYDSSNHSWVRSGIMLDYFMADVFDESPKLEDHYENISEMAALEAIQ